MKVCVSKNSHLLGQNAAKDISRRLQKAIKEKGTARLLVSTGASQFDTFKALLAEDIPWEQVEMFHLDEYVGIAEDHPASFRKYLKERFVNQVNLKKAHFITGDPAQIEEMTKNIRASSIDIGLIGIGENAHIAFNDPPADFTTREAFRVVTLDETCKNQQIGEGWFSSMAEVPTHAISMTVFQIMACNAIISCVPYEVKQAAVKNTLYSKEVTNRIPATILKTHKDFSLYLDNDSAGVLELMKIVALDGKTTALQLFPAMAEKR